MVVPPPTRAIGRWPVAVALQMSQRHDLDQMTDMQAVGGRVEADIGGERSLQGGAQAGLVGNLLDEAALVEDIEDIGHGVPPGW
jgi:hypothetical protein